MAFSACSIEVNGTSDAKEKENSEINDVEFDEPSDVKEGKEKSATAKSGGCEGGEGWMVWYDESSEDNLFIPRTREYTDHVDGDLKNYSYVDFEYIVKEGAYYKLNSDTKFCIEYDVVGGESDEKFDFAVGSVGDGKSFLFMDDLDEEGSYGVIPFDRDDMRCFSWIENIDDPVCTEENRVKYSEMINMVETSSKIKTKKIMAYNVERYKTPVSGKTCQGGEGWETWYDATEEKKHVYLQCGKK